MRRLTRLLVSATIVLALVPPPAQAGHRPSAYCSPSGDYCMSARKNADGVRRLKFATFSFRGRIKVCVKAPDDTKKCIFDRLRDRNDDGVWVSNLRWRSHFPNKGKGAYTVWWKKSGNLLGIKLGFHVR